MDLSRKLGTLALLLALSFTVKGQDNASAEGPDKDKLLEFYQTQRYAEASTYLRDFYKGETTDPKALTQLGYVNLMAGKLPEAEAIYLQLQALEPQSVAVLFNLARIQMKRGNTEKARSYYQEIVKLDSNNFNAYKQLALVTSSYDLKEKTEYLNRANTLNPTDAEVVFELCEIYFKMNLHDRAAQVLEPALKADTANLQLLKMKMPISMASKKYSEAIETGQQLLRAADSSTFVLNNLGKSHFLLLDYKKALNYFLEIEKLSADDENLLYNIALCYRGLRKHNEASTYLNKAITQGISAKTASYYGLLGDSYENTNKNQEAIAAYSRGLLFENNGSLYYNIALVYEKKLNDKKNAIANYNLYLRHYKEIAKNPKLAGFIKNKIEDLKR